MWGRNEHVQLKSEQCITYLYVPAAAAAEKLLEHSADLAQAEEAGWEEMESRGPRLQAQRAPWDCRLDRETRRLPV